eukprot:CAMPEP_0115335338 /NCGR_PEP_ID=MMETSP0270-20121206/88400_1 /TAXON_ID=71861 /ORGANISM="Scrippsiella trochoidea, Strain CCMP3099" /LENGTH=71 /DNA_ID=CAMNT_0002756399 /DNA_START=472 /DNA_END=688 /DNA_ORIENTATION=+
MHMDSPDHYVRRVGVRAAPSKEANPQVVQQCGFVQMVQGCHVREAVLRHGGILKRQRPTFHVGGIDLHGVK